MSVWLQVIFGALVLGASEGIYLLVRGLRRRSKVRSGEPRAGAD